MLIRYARRSSPSAHLIAEESDDIEISRDGDGGDVNWGRSRANTRLNPDITNATNKRVMRQLFAEHDVPMPELFNTQQAVQAVLDGKTVVGRPDRHSKKRGFWLCHNEQDIRRALRGTRRKRAATHFMEFVDAPREYRCHIFKGKSIRISEKEFFTDDNGQRDYVTIRPDRPVRRVREAAKQAVEALGLDFGAVDVLARGDDNDKVWVLEVNTAPGLGGSMPRVYAETFLAWERGEWDDD